MCHVKGAEFGKAQVLFLYLARVVIACSTGAWGHGVACSPYMISACLWKAPRSYDRFSRWKNLVCLQLKMLKKKKIRSFCAVYASDPMFACKLVLPQLPEF